MIRAVSQGPPHSRTSQPLASAALTSFLPPAAPPLTHVRAIAASLSLALPLSELNCLNNVLSSLLLV